MNPKVEFKNRTRLQLKKLLAMQAGVLLLCLAATSGKAQTVTNCTEAALRAAMAGGGAVTFSCNGTITLASTFTNAVNTVLDGSGHQVTISGGNAVRVLYVATNTSLTLINLTVANGRITNGAGIFNNGGTLTLKGTQFLTNNANPIIPSSPLVGAEGGAIYNQAGIVNATNCTFCWNVSSPLDHHQAGQLETRGGAIRNAGGVVSLRNCVFVGNAAQGGAGLCAPGAEYNGDAAGGGAVHNSGTLNVSSCTFLQNSVSGGAGAQGILINNFSLPPGWGGAGNGGAIFNNGILNVDGSMFGGNSCFGGGGGNSAGSDSGGNGRAAQGGAICNMGSLIVRNSTFASNTVAGGGGGRGGTGGVNGIYPYITGFPGGSGGSGGDGDGGAISSGGTASLVNCTIVANGGSGGAGDQGGNGGGITGSRLAGGAGGAGGSGGWGIGGICGTVNVTNCTVAFNFGTFGAGGIGGGGGQGSPWGTQGSPGTSGSAGGGLRTSGGVLANTILATNFPGNCSGTITEAGHNLSSDGTCAFTNVGSLNNTNPKLGPLADNGGPILTMALLPGSPAIDAGNTAAAPRTDQRGFPRPVGSAADIGAYEYCYLPVLQISPPQKGAVSVLVYGLPNQSCRLLTSGTLADWLSIATNQISTNGMTFFQDSYNMGQTCRVYRVVIP